MALTQAQIDEARGWITGNGLGTFNPGSGISIDGGNDNTAAAYIGGAAKAKGYGADDIAAILANGSNASGIQQYLDNNYANVGLGEASFNATQSRAQSVSPPADAPRGTSVGANPYLGQQADEISRRTKLATDQALQGIQSNAVGVGGLGGSRQGVAQGLALSGAADSLSGNLANLYGTDWTNQQNRNLQQQGLDNQYALGLGSLANQRYGVDSGADLGWGQLGLNTLKNQQDFYTAQRGQDLSQTALGNGIYNQGVQNSWTPITNANGVYNNYTGFGNTTTSSESGGGVQGALGGALGAAQLGKNFGWW